MIRTTLLVLSGALFCTTCVLGCLSFSRQFQLHIFTVDQEGYGREEGRYEVFLYSGWVEVNYITAGHYGIGGLARAGQYGNRLAPTRNWWGSCGRAPTGEWSNTFRQTGFGYWAIVPMWEPLLLFGIYPAIAFIRGPLRRHRRRKKGLCLKCGYNLTGNESGICPECGEQI